MLLKNLGLQIAQSNQVQDWIVDTVDLDSCEQYKIVTGRAQKRKGVGFDLILSVSMFVCREVQLQALTCCLIIEPNSDNLPLSVKSENGKDKKLSDVTQKHI